MDAVRWALEAAQAHSRYARVVTPKSGEDYQRPSRSIMDEVVLNRAGRGNFRAYSAGSHPKGQVHPYALDLLRKLNFDVSGLRSKSWTEFATPSAPEMEESSNASVRNCRTRRPRPAPRAARTASSRCKSPGISGRII